MNGTPLDEPYVKDGVATDGGMPAVTVLADGTFVLADNRAHSADSYTYGPVAAAHALRRPDRAVR